VAADAAEAARIAAEENEARKASAARIAAEENEARKASAARIAAEEKEARKASAARIAAQERDTSAAAAAAEKEGPRVGAEAAGVAAPPQFAPMGTKGTPGAKKGAARPQHSGGARSGRGATARAAPATPVAAPGTPGAVPAALGTFSVDELLAGRKGLKTATPVAKKAHAAPCTPRNLAMQTIAAAIVARAGVLRCDSESSNEGFSPQKN